MKNDYSSEKIVGRFKRDGTIKLHHETIYQFILEDKQLDGKLYEHLRHQNKTYRKRYGSLHNRTGIPNRINIYERPEEANKRLRVGDLEADTIIGKGHKGAILTLDDRRSKLRLTAPLPSKKAKDVREAMIGLLKPIERLIKIITYDNEKEFAEHDVVAKTLTCKSYFAKPYHYWERGRNENANGLLRQRFPKPMALDKVSQTEVFMAVDKLNSRPKKCLDYQTPYEAFQQLTEVDMKNSLDYALMT